LYVVVARDAVTERPITSGVTIQVDGKDFDASCAGGPDWNGDGAPRSCPNGWQLYFYEIRSNDYRSPYDGSTTNHYTLSVTAPGYQSWTTEIEPAFHCGDSTQTSPETLVASLHPQ
jgi:hypothetical protein